MPVSSYFSFINLQSVQHMPSPLSFSINDHSRALQYDSRHTDFEQICRLHGPPSICER